MSSTCQPATGGGRLPCGERNGVSRSPSLNMSIRIFTAQRFCKSGDIVSVTLLGKPLVILNSSHVADEMLDKKSSIYSDRPVFPVCGEVIGWRHVLALHQYGPRWREIRRLFSQTVGSHNSLAQLSGDLEHEAHEFVRRVMANPATLSQQVQR